MAEQKKYILLEHLKKLALKERADYADLIAATLAEDIPPIITVILSSTGWVEKNQKVHDEMLLADGHYRYLVCANANCLYFYLDAGIAAKDVTVTGEMDFSCTNVPKEDLTVDIVRLEVKTEHE